MKRWWLWMVFAVASLALAQYPRTLKDDLGRNITLQSEPKRIVAMLPSITETLCSMGACGRLVGVDSFSNWPDAVKALPKLGSLFDASPERIVALKPDLVLVSVYGKLHEALERAGVLTFAINTESYADIFRTARLLGEVINQKSTAERLVQQIEREVYRAETLAVGSSVRPTVYLEIDPTPYSVGPDSFLGVLIGKARGQNIVPKELGLFPQISPELVVQRNPQVMVLTHPDISSLAKRPGWANLRAIRGGRVCDYSGPETDLLSRPGPRVAEALRLLIKCFHGR